MMAFEYEDMFATNNRLAFAIRDGNRFDMLVEGDVGELKYNGKNFVDFTVE